MAKQHTCISKGPDPGMLTGYPPMPTLPQKAVLGAGSPAPSHICCAIRPALISKFSFLHHPRLFFEHCIINYTHRDKVCWKGTALNRSNDLLMRERLHFCSLLSSPEQSSRAACAWTAALRQILSFSSYSISPRLGTGGAAGQGEKQCCERTCHALKSVGSKFNCSVKCIKWVCNS